MEKPTNIELFNEMKNRGFYVSKISQNDDGIDYLVVSTEPVKTKEVMYSDIKDWPTTSNIGYSSHD